MKTKLNRAVELSDVEPTHNLLNNPFFYGNIIFECKACGEIDTFLDSAYYHECKVAPASDANSTLGESDTC